MVLKKMVHILIMTLFLFQKVNSMEVTKKFVVENGIQCVALLGTGAILGLADAYIVNRVHLF